MARTDDERRTEILAHQPMLSLALDSGATHHVVGNPQNLSNLRDLRPGVPFRVADGFLLTATRIGDISIRGIQIKDVYLVPGLKMNLISVRQLADDDIVCTFRKNYVDLSKGDELIGGGILFRGLYQICYLDATGDAAPAGAASGNDHHAAFAITGDDNSRNTAIDRVEAFASTHKAELLTETKPAEPGSDGFGATLRTCAGEEAPIVAVGCMTTEHFVVPDVGLVPLLPHGRTVISVRQLAAQGLAVTFGSKSCKIEDESTGQVGGEGRLREEEGFYYLDYLKVPQS